MNELVTVQRDGYTVSNDPARLDVDAIHAYLTTSYWAKGIPRATVARSLRHSTAYGLYAPDGTQVGCTRVITDWTTYAYLCDVYVLQAHRGVGLGVWLVATVLAHPELQGIRRLSLTTRDAHGLYEKFGFTRTEFGRFMDKTIPDVYQGR
jgi:N-acetylglutamate synthase-like GNAT family acetyltransferase